MLSVSPIKSICRHVAGHQDDDGIEVLDWWAMPYIEMDSLAKAYWVDMAGQTPLNSLLITQVLDSSYMWP